MFFAVPPLDFISTWTYNSDFQKCFLNKNEISSSDHNLRLFLLSSTGNLVLYDLRNFSDALSSYDLNLQTKCEQFKQYLKLNCCPSDRNVISVSGFDGNVYVYRVGNGLEQLFLHDGHCHVENCDKETLVSSHAWMFSSSGSSIVSCALNKTVHLWTCL